MRKTKSQKREAGHFRNSWWFCAREFRIYTEGKVGTVGALKFRRVHIIIYHF